MLPRSHAYVLRYLCFPQPRTFLELKTYLLELDGLKPRLKQQWERML